jgi:DNA-binding transcriptional ArsR family regulator
MFNMNDEKVSELSDFLRQLGEPNRLRLVLACLHEPQSVGALAALTGRSQSLVSHHLRLLRAARVLRAERRGKQVFYRPADAHIERIVADLISHSEEVEPEAA